MNVWQSLFEQYKDEQTLHVLQEQVEAMCANVYGVNINKGSSRLQCGFVSQKTICTINARNLYNGLAFHPYSYEYGTDTTMQMLIHI